MTNPQVHANDNPYLSHIMEKIPYVLSRLDREETSLTYGCGDRTYWCWKFTDFPGARFQEYLYTLSWLVTADSFEHSFYHHPNLIEWISAGIEFWSDIQHSDGSFDEAYPHEHSLAATAFTLFYVSEGYRRVMNLLSEEVRACFRCTATAAADWLCSNDEKHGFLSNHLAAAAAALYNAGQILEESRFIDRSNYFKDKILAHQSSEGWYEEYGGADPGYQTHGSFYLARLFELSGDERLLKSLQSANSFIKYFVHPDGSIGGEYASRNTMFYYPAAYEMLAGKCTSAAQVSRFQRSTIQERKGVGLWQMDAYNLFPVLNNYIFAFEACSGSMPEANRPLPWQREEDIYFPHAGIKIVSTEAYYAVVGGKKGGVLRVFDKRKKQLAFQSCGYSDRRGRDWISNQFQNTSTIQVEGNRVTVSAPFIKMNRKIFNPFLFMGFRVYSIVFGRMKIFAYWIKNLLVKKLVNAEKSYDLTLRRRIEFEGDRIIMEDRIDGSPSENLIHLDKFTTFHMGSSRYADPQEEANRGDYSNYASLTIVNDVIQKGEIRFT